MKIRKPIAAKSIPARTGLQGNARNPVYDSLAEKILALPNGKVIPVECETKKEADSLIISIKHRSPEIAASRRQLTVYFSKR